MYNVSMETSNTTPKSLPVWNAVAFVAVVAVNYIANALPLNGRTAGEISDALPSFFTPASYTFSIWGLIYLSLLGFIVYQALPANRERPFQRRIGWLFVLNSAANSAWIFAWHYGSYLLSVFIMVAILLTLIAIFRRLRIGRPDPDLPFAEKALVHFPFALYLGWITVATIANIASVSAFLGWDGFGISGPVWSAIMMVVAVLVAGLLLFQRRSLAYAGVLIWALFGIRAAYPDTAVIATTALFAAIAVAGLAAAGYWGTREDELATG